jgi:hypothetical protein
VVVNRDRVTTVIEVAGGLLCSIGAWMIAPPLGLLLAGALLILAGGLLS